MTGMEGPIAVFLLANLLAALVRVARGPTAADRILALLASIAGVAIARRADGLGLKPWRKKAMATVIVRR